MNKKLGKFVKLKGLGGGSFHNIWNHTIHSVLPKIVYGLFYHPLSLGFLARSRYRLNNYLREEYKDED